LKLLFARIGRTISPISGNEVKKDSVSDILNFIKNPETEKQNIIKLFNFNLIQLLKWTDV